MTDLFTPYAKAIVPVIVGLGLTALSYVGVTGDMTIEQVLTLAVTSALVYLVPNKKV
jgi:hypothetical protein